MSWIARSITVITKKNPVNFPYRFTLLKAAFEKHKKKEIKNQGFLAVTHLHTTKEANPSQKNILEKHLIKLIHNKRREIQISGFSICCAQIFLSPFFIRATHHQANNNKSFSSDCQEREKRKKKLFTSIKVSPFNAFSTFLFSFRLLALSLSVSTFEFKANNV